MPAHNTDSEVSSSSEMKLSPLLVAFYPPEYRHFYRASVNCETIRKRPDVIVDTIKDIRTIAQLHDIIERMTNGVPLSQISVDARLCLEYNYSGQEYHLSIGWIAALTDSSFVVKNNSPESVKWHPFCELEGYGTVELDSIEGSLVIDILPKDYLMGSILDEGTLSPNSQE